MNRSPTQASRAKAEREINKAYRAQQAAWDAAIAATPHRWDEPCGRILERAPSDLVAALTAAEAKLAELKDAAVERGLGVWYNGRFGWAP